MTKAIWLAGAAACAVLSGPAMAQTATVQGDPATGAAQRGVLVFEPGFFADSRPDSALDMIARLPGFSLDRGDSGTRGLAGAAGNVLIDGDRPSSKSDGLDQVLRRISAASVERVELIRGGAPGIDMQGRSVIANVILRRTVTVERVLELNNYFYPDGHLGPLIAGQYSRREGDRSIEGSFSATSDRTDGTSDGFRRRYDASGALVQDADLVLWDRFRNVRATGAIQRPMAGGKFRVNTVLSWFGRESTQDLLIRSGPGPDNFNDEESDSLNGELGLNWTGDLSPQMGLELVGLQRYSQEDYTGVSERIGDTSTFSSDATSGETIGRAVLRYRPNDRWAYEFGGELAYNFLDSATAFEENGVAIPLPSASVKVEELRGEAFTQATWRPSPRLTVEAGLRVEVSEISQSGDSDLSKTFVYPKPRVQVTWTPWQGHQFRFRAEREVGQLNFSDFIASADIDIGQVEGGNPDLEPDKTTVVEAVYERRFWGEGALTLSAEHGEVEDVIDVIPLTGGFDGVGNVGDGSYNVFQVSLTLPMDRIGMPNARLQTRASWVQTEVTDPVTGERRRFQGNQAFGCSVSFNQDLQGGKWSYGIDHGCDVNKGRIFRVREVRAEYAGPQVTLYGQWKPSSDTTIRLDMGNATDRERGYDRDIYDGPRDTSPLKFHEARRTKMSPWLYLQVRRSF